MKINRRLFLGSFIPIVALNGCGGRDDVGSMAPICGGSSDSGLIAKIRDVNITNIVIDSIVSVNCDLFVSNKNLTINVGCGFVINGGRLFIDSCTVDMVFDQSIGLLPKSIFRLISGKFNSINSKFNVYQYGSILDHDRNDASPPNVIISGMNDYLSAELHRDIFLDSNEFTCHVKNFCGVVFVSNTDEVENLFGEKKVCVFTAKNNSITGFHGVIAVGGLILAEISDNIIKNNSFVQIRLLCGAGISICNNKILYPGDGGAGDGINILGRVRNCIIVGNEISNGSCYGMTIFSNNIENLAITGNYFIGGVTHAIMIYHAETYDNWVGVDISENVFVGNIGGIAISGIDCSGMKLINNYFQNNLINWPSPVLSYNSSVGIFSGNLVFDNLDETLTRDVLDELMPLALPCPPIFVTGIR